MRKASSPHKSSPGFIVFRLLYSNLGCITYRNHQSLCDSVSKAGVCVSWGKIALHSMHHDISSAAGSLISRKAVGQLRVHNSKFGACAVMSIRTLHHAIFNCKNHRRRHFRACGCDCKNNADGQVFICFYTSIKQVFHFKIIGNSVTDSLSCINYAASANGKKEVNTFCTSNADPLFYQGKTWIRYNAVQIHVGKPGIT